MLVDYKSLSPPWTSSLYLPSINHRFFATYISTERELENGGPILHIQPPTNHPEILDPKPWKIRQTRHSHLHILRGVEKPKKQTLSEVCHIPWWVFQSQDPTSLNLSDLGKTCPMLQYAHQLQRIRKLFSESGCTSRDRLCLCVGCSFKSHLAFPAVQICSFFTAPAKTIFFRPHETWHFLRHLSASVYVIIHSIMDNWWIIIINIVYKSTFRVHCDKILYILIGIMCYRKKKTRKNHN